MSRRFIPRPPRPGRLLPRNPFRRRRSRFNAAPAILVVAVFGGIAVMIGGNGSPTSTGTATPAVSTAMAASTLGERRVSFRMCGSNRYTCVVDGDTLWLNGENIRLMDVDTPEPQTQICGGAAEVGRHPDRRGLSAAMAERSGILVLGAAS